jgi:hypothetical protein
MKAVFATLLIGFCIALAQDNVFASEPKLVERCEGGCSGYSHVMESTLTLMRYTEPSPERVALRVCSSRIMPLALAIAAMNPHVYSGWLTDVYNLPSRNIFLLRSEDCLGSNPDVAATELWSIPAGATLPPHVESIAPCQFHTTLLGTRSRRTEESPFEGAANYRTTLRQLITELRAKPNAVGVVYGYVLDRPSSAIRRRIIESQRILERRGLPSNRFLVRLRNWDGEYSISPPDPKPIYPSVHLVEVFENCNQ